MIAVELFETRPPARRADRHRDRLVALLGDPRVGATLRGNDEVGIGWTVVSERWNQGIATELGAASVEVAFGPLALPDVVSFTLPHNRGSRRVMEKLGFAYERDADYKGRPHVLYRLRASAHRERLRQALEHRRDRRHAASRHVLGEDRPRG